MCTKRLNRTIKSKEMTCNSKLNWILDECDKEDNKKRDKWVCSDYIWPCFSAITDSFNFKAIIAKSSFPFLSKLFLGYVIIYYDNLRIVERGQAVISENSEY